MSVCSFCEKPVYKKSLCRSHYEELSRAKLNRKVCITCKKRAGKTTIGGRCRPCHREKVVNEKVCKDCGKIVPKRSKWVKKRCFSCHKISYRVCVTCNKIVGKEERYTLNKCSTCYANSNVRSREPILPKRMLDKALRRIRTRKEKIEYIRKLKEGTVGTLDLEVLESHGIDEEDVLTKNDILNEVSQSKEKSPVDYRHPKFYKLLSKHKRYIGLMELENIEDIDNIKAVRQIVRTTGLWLCLFSSNFGCMKCKTKKELTRHHLVERTDIPLYGSEFLRYKTARMYWNNSVILCVDCHHEAHGNPPLPKPQGMEPRSIGECEKYFYG